MHSDSSYSWYNLIDKESGFLKDYIFKTITKKSGNSDIEDLFLEVVKMRNRIIHGYGITSKFGETILATKTRKNDGNRQFEITEEYLMKFIKMNECLCDMLHEYRGY